ncbi:MAG: CPBP family intramembrane metalloprotease [Anaerolineaceae bacterium]|nr:CPBP family intramembrane metalloprotease [Anaerolineaceae bacterium]
MNVETPSSFQTTVDKTLKEIKPLGWTQSLLYFGLPALALVGAYYGFRPWLQDQGYTELVSFLVALCLPLALMFAVALGFYKSVEGQPMTRAAFSARMRYPRLRGSDVLVGIGIAVLGILASGLLSLVIAWLVRSGWLLLPAGLPILDNPMSEMSLANFNQAAGGQILGQWSLMGLYLVTFFFNIAGEELWWRGIILPRQELVFGRFTWLAHGLMWAFFHVFKYWNILTLVPICLLIAYVSQKRQNNWAGLIAHAVMNGMGVVLLLAAVAGWI